MPGPMGGPGGKRTTEKAKNFKGTAKKLIQHYLGKYRIALIIVLIFAIGSTVFTIVGPKILGNATTEICLEEMELTLEKLGKLQLPY